MLVLNGKWWRSREPGDCSVLGARISTLPAISAGLLENPCCKSVFTDTRGSRSVMSPAEVAQEGQKVPMCSQFFVLPRTPVYWVMLPILRTDCSPSVPAPHVSLLWKPLHRYTLNISQSIGSISKPTFTGPQGADLGFD